MPALPLARSRKKLRILLSGMLAGDPHQGGATWAVLQYILGLLQLGHDVYFVEPVAANKIPACERAASATSSYFSAVVRQFGLEARAALLTRGGTKTIGLPYDSLRAIAAQAIL